MGTECLLSLQCPLKTVAFLFIFCFIIHDKELFFFFFKVLSEVMVRFCITLLETQYSTVYVPVELHNKAKVLFPLKSYFHY